MRGKCFSGALFSPTPPCGPPTTLPIRAEVAWDRGGISQEDSGPNSCLGSTCPCLPSKDPSWTMALGCHGNRGPPCKEGACLSFLTRGELQRTRATEGEASWGWGQQPHAPGTTESPKHPRRAVPAAALLLCRARFQGCDPGTSRWGGQGNQPRTQRQVAARHGKNVARTGGDLTDSSASGDSEANAGRARERVLLGGDPGSDWGTAAPPPQHFPWSLHQQEQDPLRNCRAAHIPGGG